MYNMISVIILNEMKGFYFKGYSRKVYGYSFIICTNKYLWQLFLIRSIWIIFNVIFYDFSPNLSVRCFKTCSNKLVWYIMNVYSIIKLVWRLSTKGNQNILCFQLCKFWDRVVSTLIITSSAPFVFIYIFILELKPWDKGFSTC